MEKSTSPLLLFDEKLEFGLATKGIVVPIEVQDRILKFKVIAERREEMKLVMAELKKLKVCNIFGWVKQPCLTKKWNPILQCKDNGWLDTTCYFCHKFVNERLSIDMQVFGHREAPQPDPMVPEDPRLFRTWKYPDYKHILLNRFYKACGDYAILWYRHFSKLPYGEMVHAIGTVGARPHMMHTMKEAWQFADNCVRVVQLMLAMEVSGAAFEQHIRELEEEFPEED